MCLMKKSLFYLAACALVIAACSMKEEEAIVPDVKDEIVPELNEGRLVTLNASVSESNTKVSVVDHKYNWQVGDIVAVFQDDGSKEPITFEAASSAASSTLTAITDKTVGKYAIYPYDPNDASDFEWAESLGNDIMTIVLPETYDFQADALNIPMLGTISGDDVTFKAIGGVIRMTVNNIPATAQFFSFEATNKQIAGEFIFEASATTPQLDLVDGATGKEIIIEFTPGTASRVFSIPCPVGTIDGFTLSLYDDSFDELYSVTSAANVAVGRNEVITAPALNVPDPEVTSTVTTYNKVSSISDGDYLIVYEDGSDAYVFNGKEEANGYVAATIADDKIAQSDDLDAVLVEIAAVTGGHTIKVKSGTNKDKYLIGVGVKTNGITFDASPVVNTIAFTAGEPTINYTNGSDDYGDFQFNTTVGQKRFRYYYNKGQSSVSLYKKTSSTLPKLNTPTGLKVTAATRTVSWKPVYHADSYTITVGETSTTQSGTSYVFAGEDDYYNVSVVAKRSDDSYIPSTAASLTNAQFGDPTLTTPTLTKGTVTTSSITVTWSNDARATNGYYCSISDGGSYDASEDNVTTGTVTFSGLDAETEYTITVYAKAVSTPLAYAQSGNGTKTISTAALTTIASILGGSDTVAKSLEGVTVLAVSTKGIYIGDATGTILAMQDSTSPADLEVGDVVNVSGTAVSTNSQRRLSNCTITNTTGSPIATGSPSALSASGLTSLASSFSRQYVSLEGKVTSVGTYYNIQIGTETGTLIALYNPISSITSSIEVGKYVAITGRTLYVTGSTTKYVYIMADSFSIHNLSASTTSKTWEYDESGSVNKIDVTITSDNALWSYNASAVTSWATVSKDGNKLTIYPTSNNTGASNHTGSIVVSHGANSDFQVSIDLVQKKQNSGTEVTYDLDFATIGTTGWSTSYTDHSGVVNNDVLSIDLNKFNKQGSGQPIVDYPVTKGAGDVVVVAKSTHTFSAVTFNLLQWNSKTKTVSLLYSTDGGSNYSAMSPAVSSSSFTLSSSNLPTGTNAVKMTFSESTNQVGIESITVTYN